MIGLLIMNPPYVIALTATMTHRMSTSLLSHKYDLPNDRLAYCGYNFECCSVSNFVSMGAARFLAAAYRKYLRMSAST